MRGKILLVDDDPRNIFALTAVLKSRGYEVISCNSAEAAIALCRHDETFDAILMDMMMPELDGYEAIPMLRQLPDRNDYIIAVTAQAMMGDRERCLAAGADEYISKPVDVDRLGALLNQIQGR